MYSGRLRSAHKRQSKSDDNKNYRNKRQRIEESLGEFDVESWKKIFTYLGDKDLASVAAVCKSFQILSQELFTKRHKGELTIEINKIGWKPVVCRFKNVISSIYITGPTIPYSDRVLDFFAKFLNKTLKEITFGCIHMNQFTNIKFRRKFLKLESLSFIVCQLNEPERITQLGQWCPNLKSLTMSGCTIRNSTLFEQHIPSLEDVTLFDLFDEVTNEKLIMFFSLNHQLKRISIDLPYEITCRSLTIVNEKLKNLEKMIWRCGDLDLLTNFQKKFISLKNLSILMEFSGICKNQLLNIIKYLPKIEVIKVVNCKQNLMTNDNLVELITKCSTLKRLEIVSISLDRKLEFGYDLHRKICHAASNRPNIDISFYYEFPFPTKSFTITKKWVKEDGRLIILAPEDLTNY